MLSHRPAQQERNGSPTTGNPLGLYVGQDDQPPDPDRLPPPPVAMMPDATVCRAQKTPNDSVMYRERFAIFEQQKERQTMPGPTQTDFPRSTSEGPSSSTNGSSHLRPSFSRSSTGT
ncbi:hypothetical protein PG989_011765 [Apiospora arundinis]